MHRLLSIAALGVAALLSGCGGKSPATPPPAAPVAAPVVAVVLPQVELDAALAAADVALPDATVILDDDGRISLAAPPSSWATPLVRPPTEALVEADLAYLGAIAGELRLGVPLDVGARRQAAGASALRARDPAATWDDPPPPEPDDDDDGGTGSAMTLDEGRMGTSDRAEGQYRMRRPAEAPVRAPMLPGPPSGAAGGADQDAYRLAFVHGVVPADGRPAVREGRTLIAASPRARARALIDVLDAAGGYLAVTHAGALRVLRIDFARPDDHAPPSVDEPWLEVRLGAAGLAFEAVPDAPTSVSWPASAPLAAADVARAWQEVRGQRALGDRDDVDVLVDDDVDVQRLIELLVALDDAGARLIGLGASPAAGSPEADARGRRIARVRPAAVHLVGDLDRAVVRDFVLRGVPAMRACYERALTTRPDLAGTVSVQFFISPTGHVHSAHAAGVAVDVSACIADVIEAIEFPKPGGGGGVQVNYSFALRH